MNEVQVFNNSEFGELEVLMIEGKPYFPASGCAKLLGYSNPRKAIIDHCRYVTKRDTPHPQNPSKTMELSFIPEGDLYRLIVRSKLPAADRFERWVFDEVLPTIGKHGAYMTPSKIKEVLLNPDTIINLASQLKSEMEKAAQLSAENIQQKQLIGEMKPKADYYDYILRNPALVNITQIAKDYGMTGFQMNKLLHELDVQYSLGGQWLLYRWYQGRGYTQSETNETSEGVMHTKWTQKGRRFIYELLKEKNIIPIIEKY